MFVGVEGGFCLLIIFVVGQDFLKFQMSILYWHDFRKLPVIFVDYFFDLCNNM